VLTCRDRSRPAKAMDAGSASEASRSQARTRTSRSRQLCADGRFACFGDRTCVVVDETLKGWPNGAEFLSVPCSSSSKHRARRPVYARVMQACQDACKPSSPVAATLAMPQVELNHPSLVHAGRSWGDAAQYGLTKCIMGWSDM